MIFFVIIPLLIGGYYLPTSSQFSGFYHLNSRKNSDYYAGAWLLSVKRFLLHESAIRTISNLEGTSVMLVDKRNKAYGQDEIGTRDYFDYFVEHMSSTTNNMKRSFFNVISKELSTNAEILYQQSRNTSDQSKYLDIRQNQTLAFLVYFSNTIAVTSKDIRHSQIRQSFLNITFWSIYRYFPHIAIFVGRQEDYASVQNFRLPCFAIENVYNNLTFNNAKEFKSKMQLIPQLALLRVNGHLKTDWKSKFNYVYFTEGDQLLHLRHIPQIFDAIGEILRCCNRFVCNSINIGCVIILDIDINKYTAFYICKYHILSSHIPLFQP